MNIFEKLIGIGTEFFEKLNGNGNGKHFKILKKNENWN